MHFVLSYLAVAVSFLAIDMVWLALMVERFYRPTLAEILRSSPDLVPAALFYLVYPLGVLAFAVVPAVQEHSVLRAVTLGMMFGFFTYATYDLTNQATLRNWSTTLTLVDILWGTLLAGLSAFLGYLVANRLDGGGA